MLQAKNRLTKRHDFENVYKNGSFFSFKGIVINVLRTKDSRLRIGFVVSKNFSKSAVKRNRTKRMLRESIRQLIQVITPGHDIIIGISPKADYNSSKEIIPVLRELLKKGRLMK